MKPLERRGFLQRIGVSAAASGALSLSSNLRSHAAAGRIRIGQIGTAHAHAAGKMATIRSFDRLYEVAGVVEPDPSRREAAAGNPAYKGLSWLSEEALLNTKGLQAVAVETAVRDLVPTAARCLAAGVHIHLDKPAGESLSEFKKLLSEAADRQLVVQMGYMFRYNPAFQFLFQSVRKGWLGELFEVHGVMSKKVDVAQRRELAEYAGGSMFELGCHLIDALVTVLGKPEKTTAYARRSGLGQDDLADNQLSVFEYPKATATVRSSLIEVEGQRRRQFTVCGDEGTAVILPLEPPCLTLTLAAKRGAYARGEQRVELPAPGGRYDGDFLDLARIVRGEKAPDYSREHDLAVHETVLRASGAAAYGTSPSRLPTESSRR